MATVVILVDNRDARGIVGAILGEMGLRKQFSYLSRKEVAAAESGPKSQASPRFIGYDIDAEKAHLLANAVLAAARMEKVSSAVDVYVD